MDAPGSDKSSAMTDTPPGWSDFYARLRGFVVARVGDKADVDDLVQLVLERAIARSAGAEPIENTMAWLLAIARNAIADHYRARARALSSAAAQLDEEAGSPPPTEEGRREVGTTSERNAEATAKTEAGQTPLHLAAATGQPKRTEYLIEQGADPKSTDRDEKTPLYYASRNGHPITTGVLKKYVSRNN